MTPIHTLRRMAKERTAAPAATFAVALAAALTGRDSMAHAGHGALTAQHAHGGEGMALGLLLGLALMALWVWLRGRR